MKYTKHEIQLIIMKVTSMENIQTKENMKRNGDSQTENPVRGRQESSINQRFKYQEDKRLEEMGQVNVKQNNKRSNELRTG